MKHKSEKDERFDSIYRTYAEDVYRACLYLSRNEDLAQEVTQQAFVNFYERFEKTKPECVKAYLIRAAQNLMKNYYRDNKKFAENDDEGNVAIPENLATESVEEQYFQEDARMVKQKLTEEILADLKESHEGWYEILHMMYLQDMDHDQIAAKLDITKDVLYSRLRRAKVWVQKKYKIEFENIKKEYP